MGGQLGLYVAGIAGILFAIAAYWLAPARRARIASQREHLAGLLVVVAAGLGISLWSVAHERTTLTFEQQPNPLAIAIAFDLSPSMLAIPHPDIDAPVAPRFERGKAVLLEFLASLEERGEPVIVAVIGFTTRASIIMGWDQSTTQVRDILDHAVAPELFGSSGTSIEAAVNALDDAFEMLPENLRATERRLAIVVSDGEDTMRASSFDYATESLERADFDIIAVQTGLSDRNEGIPVYDAIGKFSQFRAVRGEPHTRPDFAAMHTVADSTPGRGLHVHAETPGAAQQILEFATGVDAGRAPDPAWLSTLGMFFIVATLCGLLVR